jgi:hypothetical protein
MYGRRMKRAWLWLCLTQKNQWWAQDALSGLDARAEDLRMTTAASRAAGINRRPHLARARVSLDLAPVVLLGVQSMHCSHFFPESLVLRALHGLANARG